MDVGHTVATPGATSARGVPEYRFNATLARDIVRALTAAGYRRTILVNDNGRIGSLAERAGVANRFHAAIYLAIHHDAVQPRYLETWTFEGRPLPFSDRFHGFSLFVSRRNRRAGASERFGRLLARELLRRGNSPSLHHAEPIPGEGRPLLDRALGLYQFDDLVVLHEASMPALLLEAGVIVNRDEEAALFDPSYRGRVVGAVVAAIGEFCSEADSRRSR